ncbi:MAG TPA: hypothetical protein VM390_06180 [Acidimicrobiales bacterium]|nr:hypothetical protein [Acidimicrobiales bacterium]
MRNLGSPTAAVAGVDRVGWVRVEIGDAGPTCQVVGTTRRRVVTRRVTLPVATALIARGIPSVVRHRSLSRPVAART